MAFPKTGREKITAAVSVSSLFRYPIKSCRGFALGSAIVGRRGIEHDREWMIFDNDNEFLTQREFPRMALIEPSITDDGNLILNAPEMSACQAPAVTIGPEIRVRVWDDWCGSIDQGDDVADWLSEFLGKKCRLARLSDFTVRRLDERYTKTGETGFADGYPFLLTSEESLADLNRRLVEVVPMNRFRPNIVVSGSESFAEDDWKAIRIGGLEFRVVKPCARCVITTVDQSTGIKGTEPLKTLAAYRRSERGVMFGQNLVHCGPGAINVGDAVEILE